MKEIELGESILLKCQLRPNMVLVLGDLIQISYGNGIVAYFLIYAFEKLTRGGHVIRTINLETESKLTFSSFDVDERERQGKIKVFRGNCD